MHHRDEKCGTYRRIDLRRYIVVSIWFGCNNRCRICMLSDLKKSLPPLSYEQFQDVCTRIMQDGRYDRLILSGAEVTTHDDLERFVRFASSLGWFRKIQIQTNGRRLRDRAYLHRLIDSGADEFFVSVHGLGGVHDAVTQRPGSFDEVREGLANLSAAGVDVITNTVLTSLNEAGLGGLAAFLTTRGIRELHLWNFFPMAETDEQDLIVDLETFSRRLAEMARVVEKAGAVLVLKGFPECLSRGGAGVFDNFFPETILPDRFWGRFQACGFGTCVHKPGCGAEGCWGLSRAYVRKYGDARDLLSPMEKRPNQGGANVGADGAHGQG